MGPTPKCHFVPRFPSWSLEILKIKTLAILETHIFVCTIEMRSTTNFVALKESFPIICGTPLTCKGIRAILDF